MNNEREFGKHVRPFYADSRDLPFEPLLAIESYASVPDICSTFSTSDCDSDSDLPSAEEPESAHLHSLNPSCSSLGAASRNAEPR